MFLLSQCKTIAAPVEVKVDDPEDCERLLLKVELCK